MKRTISCLLSLLLLLSLCACGGQKEAARPTTMPEIAQQIDGAGVSAFKPSTEPTNYVKLTVEGYGALVICLREDFAPITVKNFQDLVAQGFYDGLTFHRVYPGFMIQGGSLDGIGVQGSSQTIQGEFAANGVENNLSHIRGVISMARRGDDYNSASSQFFIMHADNGDILDGSYAAFGYVVAGMDTVDKICQTELTFNDWGEYSQPTAPIVIASAEFVKP